MSAGIEIYTEIEKQSLPLINYFKEDLIELDKTWFETTYKRGYELLHITHDNGTHMIVLPPFETYTSAGQLSVLGLSKADRVRVLESKMDMLVYLLSDRYGGRVRLIQYVDKKGMVHTVDKSRAMDLTKDYTRKMTVKFGEDNGVRV